MESEEEIRRSELGDGRWEANGFNFLQTAGYAKYTKYENYFFPFRIFRGTSNSGFRIFQF